MEIGFPTTSGGTIVGDGIQAPVSNVTYATNGAGALTGTYYYSWTYVTAAGETAVWPGTPSGLVLSAQQVRVTVPVGPAGVIARKLYRSKAGNTEPKNTFLLATIADNTTTTYDDNAADGTLGAAVKWSATNRGYITDGVSTVAQFSDQTTTLGQGARGGYASVAVGFNALNLSEAGSFRNTATGVYAGALLTTGYQNCFYGTHAGNGVVTGIANSFFGYASGGTGTAWSNFNVMVGQEAGGGAGATGGSSHVFVGYRAGFALNTADQCMGIGPFAGAYANTSRQGFIDTGGDRGNIANAQNNGLFYFKGEGTPQAQVMNLNAGVRVGALITVANLPAASGNAGRRFTVSDASVAYTSANVGSIAAGGGANTAPVFSNGTNWVIG